MAKRLRIGEVGGGRVRQQRDVMALRELPQQLVEACLEPQARRERDLRTDDKDAQGVAGHSTPAASGWIGVTHR